MQAKFVINASAGKIELAGASCRAETPVDAAVAAELPAMLIVQHKTSTKNIARDEVLEP